MSELHEKLSVLEDENQALQTQIAALNATKGGTANPEIAKKFVE